MDDAAELERLNERFIDAFRQGSWALLEPILSPRFQYLDGTSGEVWPMEKYIHNLDGHASPELSIDELVIHIDGDIAVVSARTSRHPANRHNRYVDTYERHDGTWRCVHACVWPVRADAEESQPARGERARLTSSPGGRVRREKEVDVTEVSL